MNGNRSDIPITYNDLKRLFFRIKGLLKSIFWMTGSSVVLLLLCQPITFLAKATFKEGRVTSPSESELKEWFQRIGGLSQEKTVAKNLMQSQSLLRGVVQELGMQVEKAPRIPFLKLLRSFKDNIRVIFGQRPYEEEAFTFRSTVYAGEIKKYFWVQVIDFSTFALLDEAKQEIGRWRVGEKIQCPDFSGYLTQIPSWARPHECYRFTWIPWVNLVKKVKKRLAIRPLQKTEGGVLVLSFRDWDRYRASDFLNQLMDAFLQRLYLENEAMVSVQLAYLVERKKELLSQWDGTLRDHVAYLRENLERGEGGLFAQELEALQQPRHQYMQRLLEIDAEIRRLHWQSPSQEPKEFSKEEQCTQELLVLRQQKAEAEAALGALKEGKDPLAQLSLLNDPRTLVGLWAQQIIAYQNPNEKPPFYQKQWKMHLEGFLEQADCKIRTLEERQAFCHPTSPLFIGLTLPAAQNLLAGYHEQKDKLQVQWKQLVFLAGQLYEPQFELSSISTLLSDPVTQQLVVQAGETAVRLQDVSNRSLREQEYLQETLVTQKRFLEHHLAQMVELTKLRLGLTEDQISALRSTVLELLLHEKQILEEQLGSIGQKMAGLPEKWHRENILTFNKEMGINMMEGLTQVMEMKHLDRTLYQVESKPIDIAIPPFFPENPWVLPLAVLSALLVSAACYLFYFFRTLMRGFPVSHEALTLSGWHNCGTLLGDVYEKIEHVIGTDLEALRKIAQFIQWTSQSVGQRGLVCAILGGRYPDFTPVLAELLAMRQHRVLLIRYVFDEVIALEHSTGLWSYLQGEVASCPIQKRETYDYICSGSTTRYGTEGLSHPKFQSFLEAMQQNYDLILIYSHAMPKEAEGEALLSLAGVTVVVARDETLEDLEGCRIQAVAQGKISPVSICFS